jgi:hypothetical protein
MTKKKEQPVKSTAKKIVESVSKSISGLTKPKEAKKPIPTKKKEVKAKDATPDQTAKAPEIIDTPKPEEVLEKLQETPVIKEGVDYESLIPDSGIQYYLGVIRDTIMSRNHFIGTDEKSGTEPDEIVSLIKRNDYAVCQVNMYDNGDSIMFELIKDNHIGQVSIRKSIAGCSGVLIN